MSVFFALLSVAGLKLLWPASVDAGHLATPLLTGWLGWAVAAGEVALAALVLLCPFAQVARVLVLIYATCILGVQIAGLLGEGEATCGCLGAGVPRALELIAAGLMSGMCALFCFLHVGSGGGRGTDREVVWPRRVMLFSALATVLAVATVIAYRWAQGVGLAHLPAVAASEIPVPIPVSRVAPNQGQLERQEVEPGEARSVLMVRVISADGDGLPGARVSILGAKASDFDDANKSGLRPEEAKWTGRCVTQLTSDSGIVNIDVPSWLEGRAICQLRVECNGYQSHGEAWSWSLDQKTIVLVPGGVISGRIAMYNDSVPLDPTLALFPVGLDAPNHALRQPIEVPVQADGYFSVGGLDSCDYELVARASGCCMHPLRGRRIRPGAEPISLTMVPVLGAQIEIVFDGFVGVRLPRVVSQRMSNDAGADYARAGALPYLCGLTGVQAALLEAGVVRAGMVLNPTDRDYSGRWERLTIGAPELGLEDATFDVALHSLWEAFTSPQPIVVDAPGQWMTLGVDLSMDVSELIGRDVILVLKNDKNRLAYTLICGEVSLLAVPVGRYHCEIVYDAFSEKKLLGKIDCGSVRRADITIDATPASFTRIVPNLAMGGGLQSFFVKSLRGVSEEARRVRLRNFEVFGKGSVDLPNYPEGSYEVVIGYGDRAARSTFDIVGGVKVQHLWMPW